MRKVYVDLKVRLVIQIDEGIQLEEVIDELDYNFVDTTTQADVIDTEIKDWEVTDSK